MTPHMLRHTWATLLLNAGTPILAVRSILGHKNSDTTLRCCGIASFGEGDVLTDRGHLDNQRVPLALFTASG